MISLPIPFVVTFLLVLTAGFNHHHLKETPTGRAFLGVIYLYALTMLLVGFRWSLDWVVLMPAAATLFITSSALLYLAFRSLGRPGPVISIPRDLTHLIPIALVATTALLQPMFAELIQIIAQLRYVGLMTVLAQHAPDSLQLVRFSWLKNTQRALWAAVLFLLVSALVDASIAIDFAYFEGHYSESLVGSVNLVVLLLMGWIAVAAGRGRVIDNDNDVLATAVTEASAATISNSTETDDAALLHRLNTLLIDDGMYADAELNLQKLARKSGIPARKISRAINAHTGQNMSQWVNSARIDAACKLLNNEKTTVSEAMFEAGFMTKSNFNREFKRIKGCSPSEWRCRAAR